MRSSGFDRLAPFYDFLVLMVFGDEIRRSQLHFLQDIKEETKLLIVGGGSGSLLPALLKNRNLSIDFLDISEVMLSKAKTKIPASGEVAFIHADFLSFQTDRKYDFILLPFFLDMFLPSTLERIAQKVHKLGSSSAQLVVADFIAQSSRWTMKALTMKVMYYFFRFTCAIEAGNLADWQAIFDRYWKPTGTAVFFHGMIGAYKFEKR